MDGNKTQTDQISLYKNIYTDFVSNIESTVGLIDTEDVSILKRKRGLTQETINEAKLISGKKDRLIPSLEILKEKYAEKDLIDSGILHENKLIHIRWIEDERNPKGKIIIPYLSKDQEVIYLRCHKLGPSNVPIQIYGQHIFEYQTDHVVITEGEFKSLALIQNTIPSIAIPGISSFGGKHLYRLIKLLKKYLITKVTILFDNEVKNDPKQNSYKPDPMDRWDTEYWACRMAKQIKYTKNYKFQTVRIARLPDNWRVDGKIDPDQALTLGKKKEDFTEVIENAKEYHDYIKSLPEKEARVVVYYKIEKDRMQNGNLNTDYKNYRYTWQSIDPEGNITVEPQSNFILDPLFSIKKADTSYERRFLVKSAEHQEEPIEFNENDWSRLNHFKKKLLKTEDFVWYGGQKQLDHLQGLMAKKRYPKVAIEVNCYGRISETNEDYNRIDENISNEEHVSAHGYWVFRDGIIKDEKFYPIENKKVVWGDGLIGIIPPKNGETASPHVEKNYKDFIDPYELFEKLTSNIKNENVDIALGWIWACVFADFIFEKYGFFPILGVFGQAGCGKTTFCHVLTSMWGLENHATNPIKFSTSTPKGVDRTLSKMASLPVWVDEFRNDIQNNSQKKIIDSFRSTYNRQSGVAAVYSGDNKTTTNTIRGCLILSGEELPTDTALRQRTIPIFLQHVKRDATLLDELQKAAKKSIGVIIQLIIQSEEIKNDLLDYIENIRKNFVQIAEDDRIATNFAICIGTYCFVESFFSEIEEETLDVKINNAIRSKLGFIKNTVEEIKQDDHINHLWESIDTMIRNFDSNGVSIINRIHLHLSSDKKHLHLNFKDIFGLYYEFSQRRSGRKPFNQKTIENYLKELPYVDKKKTPRKITKKQQIEIFSNADQDLSKRFYKIDLEHNQCPDILKEIAKQIFPYGWDKRENQMYEYEKGNDENEYPQ